MEAAEETEVRVAPSLAFGMREREERMVFEHLLLLSMVMSTRWQMNALAGLTRGRWLPMMQVHTQRAYNR
jgi:hypothetical protein